jgi:hypothetical protein
MCRTRVYPDLGDRGGLMPGMAEGEKKATTGNGINVAWADWRRSEDGAMMPRHSFQHLESANARGSAERHTSHESD